MLKLRVKRSVEVVGENVLAVASSGGTPRALIGWLAPNQVQLSPIDKYFTS